MAPRTPMLRRTLDEVLSYFRRFRRARSVRLDGIRVRVDYERWSPLLVHRVLANRYEVEERALIPRILSQGDRVLEIGGGVGLIAMLCARSVGAENVFVYEANPQILDAAKDNFRRNGLDIAIDRAAVVGGSYEGDSVTFFLDRNFWSSSLLEKGDGGERVAISAPAVTLDALIARHQPSLIIADVEGAEYDILLSTDLTSVQKLCVECHTRYIGARKVSDLIRSLLDRGFCLELEQSVGEVLYFSKCPAG